MKRILIVDDDEAFLYQYHALLSAKGYHTSVVSNAIDIFETIEKHKPDLIILDTFINDYDGRTIGKMLKLTESTRDIPIILCSVNAEVGKVPYNRYANLFLSKPFNVDDLLAAVNALINAK